MPTVLVKFLFLRSVNELLTHPDDFGHNFYFVSPILMSFEALEI
jgi:hypothetical protein